LNKAVLLVIFGLSGMAALIYEITWIRPLSVVFGTTMYAVSTIIASFILGLALGSWLAGKFSDKMKNPLRYFAFFQIGIGAYGVFLLPMFSLLPDWYLAIYHLTFPNQPIFMAFQVLMAMSLITIPATMMGTTLPLMMRIYSLRFENIGRDVGKLDASNSIGAVVGTLAAGFLMIPVIGIQNTIIITAIINVGMGCAILSVKRYVHYSYLILIIVSIVAFFYLYPGYNIDNLSYGVYAYHDEILYSQPTKELFKLQKILFYEESMYASVLVAWWPDDNYRLVINGKTQCSTIPHVKEGLVNFASIPFELYEYNYGKPANSLNVGLGCGMTSKWLSERTNTTTVEIDPVVTETTKFFVDKIDHELVIDDARNWLLRNSKKFDIIATEPFDPYVNNGGMYTLEYFRLLSEHLNENGLVSQWVPNFELTQEDFTILYNTFHEVFPHIYVYRMENGDDAQWVMIGSKKPLLVKDNDLFLFDNEELKIESSVLNTDDKPVLEFAVARNIYD